jgi:hypothetical protein
MLLDQSFPKDDFELAKVKIALGSIQDSMEKGNIGLLLTEYIIAIADEKNLDFTRYNESESLREIMNILRLWILQPSESIEKITLPDDISTEEYSPHAIPEGMEEKGLIEFWCDELGKILHIHDKETSNNNFFIGIACDSAFAEGPLGSYTEENNQRVFPLIGPDNISCLNDAYEWVITNPVTNNRITKEELIRNHSCLGIITIEPPDGSSHSKCLFENGKFWILDMNNEVIPHNHIRTLSEVTELPNRVIINSIKTGDKPKKEFLLSDYQT